MTTQPSLDRAFLDYSAAKLRQNCARIEVCLGKLNEDQIWSRGHETENSVGNLCLHLAGNVRQWILSGIAGEPDHRARDGEFSARGGTSCKELAERLRETVESSSDVISGLTPQRLAEHVTVQSYRLTALEAVYHVVEHFSYHAGQILFATKAASGEDLGFHRHLTQPQHAEKTP